MNEFEFQTCLNESSNFQWASRIAFSELTTSFYEEKVIKEGVPLVASGSHDTWTFEEKNYFTLEFLKRNYDNLKQPVRDVNTLEDVDGTLGQYIDSYLLNTERKDRVLYGKDIHCPNEWTRILKYFFSSTHSFSSSSRSLFC